MKLANFWLRITLGDHLPLKQGLRLMRIYDLMKHLYCLGDHLPLKQGLRLLRVPLADVIIHSETIFH